MKDPDYRKLLIDHFSADEIRDLCFDLGVEFEDLPDGTRSSKVRDLIGFLKRRKRLPDLHKYIEENRPEVLGSNDEAQPLNSPKESDKLVSDDHLITDSDPKKTLPPGETQVDDDEEESSRRRNPFANPFTYGHQITEPDRFFGRQREVQQVFSRLLNPEAESSSIVGGLGIGKTSLLNYLAHPEVHRQHGLDLKRFNFVYIDLQVLNRNATPSHLWRHIVEQMARQSKEQDIKKLVKKLQTSGIIDKVDYFVLANLFDDIHEKGQRIVLLFDEFENVADNSNFGHDFFYGLRSLATKHNLSLITSSCHALIDLTHSETNRSSPFFSIFANIELGLLSEEEVQQLIIKSLGESDISFTKSEVEAALCIAGPYPHFLQIACYFLFQAYRESTDPVDRLKYLEIMFAREASPHFEFFWNDSDKDERIVLLILALSTKQSLFGSRSCNMDDLESLYSLSGQAVTRLEKRALVVKELSDYTLFSSAFGEWINDMFVDSAGNKFSYNTWFNPIHNLFRRLRGKDQVVDPQNLPGIKEKYRNLIIRWINNTSNPEKVVDLLKNAFS